LYSFFSLFSLLNAFISQLSKKESLLYTFSNSSIEDKIFNEVSNNGNCDCHAGLNNAHKSSNKKSL